MVQTSLAAWLKGAHQATKKDKKNATTQSDGDSDSISKALPVPSSSGSATGTTAENASRDEAKEPEELDEQGPSTQEAPPPDTVAVAVTTPQQQPPTVPPNATLASITADTLPAFRRMTSLLLPVPYPHKFYADILADPVVHSISLVALWTDATSTTATATTPDSKPRVVAGIRCRLLASSPALPTGASSSSSGATTGTNGSGNGSGTDARSKPSLYISTLTTLAPFRNHGLARALLRHVILRAVHEYDIGTVTAHMWEANADARAWYEKMGFRDVAFEGAYYRRLRPQGGVSLGEAGRSGGSSVGEGMVSRRRWFRLRREVGR